LLLVALGHHPYGYYTFLRWAVTVAAVTLALFAYRQKRTAIVAAFVGIAILFNPLAPVYLKRSTWQVLDVIVALAFIASLALHEREPAPAPAMAIADPIPISSDGVPDAVEDKDRALELARERHARGEIDRQAFLQIRTDLRSRTQRSRR
jgi:hypothetical protein